MADLAASAAWRAEDAAWERMQAAVRTALAADDLPLARQQAGAALALARAHFQAGDPRLAATLALQAWLLRPIDPRLAGARFREADMHWAQGAVWLAAQPPPVRRARSSIFHLRLESKHPGAYRNRLVEDMRALLAEGQARHARLREAGDDARPADALPAAAGLAFDTWRKVRTAVDLLPA